MTAKKQSSASASSLAANMLGRKKWIGLSGETLDRSGRYVPVEEVNKLLAEAKKLAGSVLSQDETKGLADAA